MKSKDTQKKREREMKVVQLMIKLYCQGHKHGDLPCKDCKELMDYAKMRIDKCPFMETKTFCSNCKVHCYKPEMREKIKEVMRYAGPRMLFHHPIMAIDHVRRSRQEKYHREDNK